MEDLLNTISSFVWGPPILVLLLGTGLFLTLGLKFLPQRKLGHGIALMFEGRRGDAAHPGEITPFQALTTALSATIGTGNIAGVATAIFLGGPGAVFWMWLTALVGMATKYAEAVLAVQFRETGSDGRTVGGPMYYIRNGLGPRFAWLAWLFAFFATIAAFGIGNTVQANSVAQAVQSTFGVPVLWTGMALAALTFIVVIGGVKRIGSVAEFLVPLMAVLYITGALSILVVNAADVPAAFALIFEDAFTGTAATGGFAGAAVMAAIRFGVARGVFSNEAGLGSAPIAHAAALTDDPVRQGNIAMLGTFIDTILICSMTALVIITTGVWTSGETGAALSALAFSTGLPGGELIVSLGLIVFAFTTILGWSYYGERAAEYLFGPKIILPFRLLWVAGVVVGAISNLGMVWIVADIMNALMAIPNLIALIALSGTVFAVTRAYWKKAA
ncbi:alanine/glycine:cation symporter family protein [Phaeovulum vinaykumarii]|uniref:Alanine or glycine:cation symporter, AGCS family n=1 Tax=Phaeovulum vinaykumarii TaxID=407234 RepID=A0A1N7MFP2_9RHOB|nr:sodium:alanine symporter family protein [Phaeovulum vinaykumarii]SIS84801.1 alanine or glycine:cation symporter, AGCS family [Phaeovulum vinaykumarii]SOC11950.1 AGCS family alanine or glycine:cation symporter [Phaeovulum vinaykumarii]